MRLLRIAAGTVALVSSLALAPPAGAETVTVEDCVCFRQLVRVTARLSGRDLGSVTGVWRCAAAWRACG